MSDEKTEQSVPTFTTDEPNDQPIEEALEEMESGNESVISPEEPEADSSSGLFADYGLDITSVEPHTPLEEVDYSLDLDNGGFPRIMRGINKASPSETEVSKQAWFDIALGTIELMYQLANDPMGDETEDEDGNPNLVTVSKDD